MAFESSNGEFVSNYHERAVVAFDKLEESEKNQAIAQINQATAEKDAGPAKIFKAISGIVLKFAGIPVVAVLFLLAMGCADDKRAIAGHQTENRALQAYVANNRALVESVAEWSREVQAQVVQANFERDVNQITQQADKDGKVSATEVKAAVLKWDADKRAAIDKINAAIAKVYADRDAAELPLAQMYEIRSALEKYHESGADPEAFNGVVDGLVTKINGLGQKKPAKAKPAATTPVKPTSAAFDSESHSIAFIMHREGMRGDTGTKKEIWTVKL